VGNDKIKHLFAFLDETVDYFLSRVARTNLFVRAYRNVHRL